MKASVFHITIVTQPSFTTYDKDCKTSSFLIQNLWTNCCFFILGTGLRKRCKGIGSDLVELYVKSPALANLRKKTLLPWSLTFLSQSVTQTVKRKKERKTLMNICFIFHLPWNSDLFCITFFFTSYKHISSIQMIIILSSWGASNITTSIIWVSEDCTVSRNTTVFADSKYFYS